MDLKSLIKAVNSLIDDSLPNTDIIDWINFALGDLGVACHARFPKFTPSDMNKSPVIPEDYHELLVLYASARAKEQDSSTVEADRFMAQYEAKKREFVATYEVPPELSTDKEEDMNEAYLSTLPNPYGWTW